MRLSDCIVCVFIYYNLPGLLHRNAGNARLLLHEGILSVRRLPVHRGRGGEYYRRLCVLFVLPQSYKNNFWLIDLWN